MLLHNLLFSEGLYILLALVIALVIGFLYWRPLVYLSFILLFFSVYFFRSPQRVCPVQQHAIIAPADGVIIDISSNLNNQMYTTRLSIFLSVWDAHVQWAPCAGIIETIAYHPGAFMVAYLPKSSFDNEHNDITIRCSNGVRIMVRQIAGIIARRISCWVHEGQLIAPCEKIGMIRFGSRVDLLVPHYVQFTAHIGDRVKGGESVIGYFVSENS